MGLSFQSIRYQDIYFDSNHQAFFRDDNERLDLRPKSSSVFLFLIENSGKVVSKSEIFNAVWGHAALTDDSLVQCIAEIRRVIGDKDRKLLQTLPRRGYLLDNFDKSPSRNDSLPEDLLPLFGREKELVDLGDMLHEPACRLICLSGLGGVGKSRLAKAVGKVAVASFQDGIYFIPLVALQKVDLIPGAIARAMEVATQGPRSATEQLISELKQKEVLLILDNMEHLLSGEAFCCLLLERCPGLKILATSRVALASYGSWNYQLHGLAVPDSYLTVNGNAAYDLFIQSARRANYTFQPDTQDTAYIVDICRLVGGMPLGIEVAAAWTQHLSCAEILLEMRGHILPDSSKGTTAISDRSLSTVMQRSWQMLNEREQKVMCSLGLFRGHFSRDAAVAIAGATHDDFMVLINKSMLMRDSEGYFVLHEVMRQYAGEQALSLTSHANTQRFVDYHLQRAALADKAILGGGQFEWLTSLEHEHANFRESLTLCIAGAVPGFGGMNVQQAGLQLSGSLGWFWFLANHWQEGRKWAEHFLSSIDKPPQTTGGSQALLTAGGLATLLDDYPVAYRQLSCGINIAREIDDPGVLSRGLAVMSVLHRLQGEYKKAITVGQEAMVLFRQQQDWGGYMLSLGWYGQSLTGKGQYQQALPVFEECLQLNQKVGHTISLPHALVNLGYVQWKLGQLIAARAYLDKAISTSEQCGTLLYLAQALCFLGWLELTDGHLVKAQSCFQQSAEHYLKLGDNTGLAEVLGGMAALAVRQGDFARAGQLLGGVEAVRSKLLAAPHPGSEKLLSQVLAELRKHLSSEEMALYRNLGLATGVDEFIVSYKC